MRRTHQAPFLGPGLLRQFFETRSYDGPGRVAAFSAVGDRARRTNDGQRHEHGGGEGKQLPVHLQKPPGTLQRRSVSPVARHGRAATGLGQTVRQRLLQVVTLSAARRRRRGPSGSVRRHTGHVHQMSQPVAGIVPLERSAMLRRRLITTARRQGPPIRGAAAPFTGRCG